MLKNTIINIFLIGCGITTIWGCKENFTLGLESNDTIAPDLPVVKEIKNINGGAVIYFDIPKAEDLLCINTSYVINGKSYTKRTSPYVDSVVVDGFAEEKKYNVTLRSMDKSKNESESVNVEIEPLESPLQIISKSIKMSPAFGGIRFTWKNPTEASVILGIMKKDSYGEWKLLTNIYTNVKEGVETVRGLNAEPQEIGIFVRDRWDNYSDKTECVVTPIFEEFINPKTFKALFPPMPDDATPNRNHPIQRIWDGETTERGYCCLGARENLEHRYVTFDLGKVVKLSRYTIWHRSKSKTDMYGTYNLKYYDIYGCEELTPEMREKGSLEGWHLLYKAKCYKPSGDGPVTNEDKAYILKGDSHEFPLDIPNVRYIRIDMIESYQKTLAKGICEMKFWGQYIN